MLKDENEAYCYFFNSATKESNAPYPGVKMLSTPRNDTFGFIGKIDLQKYNSVIFNMGEGKTQTVDITLKGTPSKHYTYRVTDPKDGKYIGVWIPVFNIPNE